MVWQLAKKKPEPALFLHIQKTAGSTIVDFAKRNYRTTWGRNVIRASRAIGLVPNFDSFNVISHGDYIGHHPEEFENRLFVSGHFGYDFARYFMSSRYSFVFLRNPVDRVLSFYYFCRNKGSDEYPVHQMACQLDLEQFLQAGLEDPHLRTCLWNHQTWQLAHGWGCLDMKDSSNFDPDELLEMAKDHLHDFSHVGFTETFENDRDIIFKALNWPIPTRKVHSNASGQRPARDELSTSAIDLLNELTKLDQSLFATAWDAFHADVGL